MHAINGMYGRASQGVVSLSIFHEYLCKLGFVIAGLTRNLLRLEKIAGQARNDNAAYLFVFLLNETGSCGVRPVYYACLFLCTDALRAPTYLIADRYSEKQFA